MTDILIGIGFFAVLGGLSALVGRLGGVSPRVAAGAHLVSLVGWALVPAVWLVCSGSALGAWLAGIRVAGGGCLLGLDHRQWTLIGYLPGATLLGVVGWHGLRLAAAAHRTEMRGLALLGSVRRPTTAGEVWVVPAAQPLACATGLWRCRAVVSSGLLAPLEPPERAAVCEHEAAHVRLGHPRLLLFATAVAGAYGGFSPVRRACDGLRRELEAAADDEAATVVGAPSVLSALVKVALMRRGPAAGGSPAFGDADHLRWRIARLEQARPAASRSTVLVGTAAAVTASAMALVGCSLAGASLTPLAVASCLAVVAAVGLRPLWGWSRRTR